MRSVERGGMMRRNNFDALRLLGALLVFGSHHWALQGLPEPQVGEWTTWGGLGVAIFFSISGYLISQSWLRDPHLGRYALRRSLRIIPGLAVVVTVCAVVLGPLMTSLSVQEYFRHPQVWDYFRNIMLYPIYTLPGVFADNPYPHAVNGSLWTLPLECFLYFLIVAILSVEKIRQHPWIMCVFSVGLAVLGQWIMDHRGPWVFYGTDVRYLGMLAPYFCMGSFCALLERRGYGRSCFCLPVALGGLGVMAISSGWMLHVVAAVVIPYATLAVGVRSWPVVRHAARWGDVSYGVYIYAFPMQQTALALWGREHGWAAGGLALLGTLVCATFSWHGVERPMLALKPRTQRVQPQGPVGMQAPCTVME
jgi:peptidoglycan/LPS O-acetylase OafA/YrhL